MSEHLIRREWQSGNIIGRKWNNFGKGSIIQRAMISLMRFTTANLLLFKFIQSQRRFRCTLRIIRCPQFIPY